MDPERFASLLKQTVDDEAARHRPPSGGWSELERRLRREPWRRAATLIVSIVAAVAVAFAAQLVIRRGGPSPSSPVPARLGGMVVLTKISLPDIGVNMATGYGAAWIPANGVTYQVDQATGRLVRTISTPGTSPVGCGSGVATGFGAVWVSYGCRGMYRIDARPGHRTGNYDQSQTGAYYLRKYARPRSAEAGTGGARVRAGARKRQIYLIGAQSAASDGQHERRPNGSACVISIFRRHPASPRSPIPDYGLIRRAVAAGKLGNPMILGEQIFLSLLRLTSPSAGSFTSRCGWSR